ncbi:hypothetical protein HJFPF1_07859 [Paramyrothecium foliicola]|nr:hypothetical protein HJFPF1_07859 [Paramyrothecium foliicola]
MTQSPSGSPPSTSAASADETQFPRGHCRYILMTPGLKGQRCACVSFIHNKAVPGATCDCGHLSCFHVAAPEHASPGKNRNELELLKQRVQLLEEPTDWAAQGGLGPVPQRVRLLEEAVERHRDEVQADIKGAYRSVSGAWQLVEQLQKKLSAFEDIFRAHSDQLTKAGKDLKELRNRQLELQDSDESLEERIEKLEGNSIVFPVRATQYDVECAIDSSNDATSLNRAALSRRPSIEKPQSNPLCTELKPAVATELDEPERPSRARRRSGSWTVHVSLLPSKEQTCPFERDTSSYKRCLSRGLHRMVAVEGTDNASLVKAVSRAFRGALQDRPWEPLQVEAPNAGTPSTLPRLKPLDADMAAKEYDVEFLRTNCAVCDSNGRPESIYIAPRDGKLPWSLLKQLPIHVEGLESSWAYDKHLDGTEGLEEDGSELLMLPPASLSASPASSLKRSISEISLSTRSSTSSATSQEYLSPRSKVARTCMSGIVEISQGISATL